MSLLLQALQKAAKNRESTAPAAPTEAPSRPSQPESVEIVLPSSFRVEPAVEEPPKERELSPSFENSA
jgi:hypothetical protein